MLVRYSNCKVWLGYGLGFADTLTVQGDTIANNSVDVETDIDCGGKVIIPAFVDAHAHPVLAGRESRGPDVAECTSIDEIKSSVSEWLELNPDTDWVVGGPYNRSISPDGKFQASWLDDVSTTRPIVLHADDHHTIWVNSAAMALSGVLLGSAACATPGVDLGAQGAPSGTFREADAKNLILENIPRDSDQVDIEAIAWSQQTLIEHGITAVFDAWVDETLAESYLKAAENELMLVETKLALWLEPDKWRRQLANAVSIRERIAGINSDFLEVTGVKIFVDGVLGSATAAVSQPYISTSQHGSKFWDDKELKDVCRAATELGFGLHLHTIGDAAVGSAIEAIEGLKIDIQGPHALHPVLAHVELLGDEDIRRLQQNFVGVNIQPLWGRPDDLLNSCRAHVGKRVDELYRTRDLLDEGVSVAFGSDWPVSSVNPFLGLYTAVTRRVPGAAATQNPGQIISLEEALKAYTSEAAKHLGLASRGTLQPGMKADFLILSEDPFSDPEALPRIHALQTISGGQTRFTRH